MKRKIINIDQEKCTGCGQCIPNCPEGAIQMIDNKARLISDLFCDGLGACLGHCPEEAITIEEREAEAYDERRVMENIVRQGPNTIKAHLLHLKDHGETAYLKQALSYLAEKGVSIPSGFGFSEPAEAAHTGCPGARAMHFEKKPQAQTTGPRESSLTHWPVQLHLMSPMSPAYKGKDVLLSADCVAFALGNFHDYLSGKALAIACPKLDEGQEVYLEKLKALIDHAGINTLHVMIMQVPCCRGLLALAQKAVAEAARKVPIKCTVVGIQGEILTENWVTA